MAIGLLPSSPAAGVGVTNSTSPNPSRISVHSFTPLTGWRRSNAFGPVPPATRSRSGCIGSGARNRIGCAGARGPAIASAMAGEIPAGICRISAPSSGRMGSRQIATVTPAIGSPVLFGLTLVGPVLVWLALMPSLPAGRPPPMSTPAPAGSPGPAA